MIDGAHRGDLPIPDPSTPIVATARSWSAESGCHECPLPGRVRRRGVAVGRAAQNAGPRGTVAGVPPGQTVATTSVPRTLAVTWRSVRGQGCRREQANASPDGRPLGRAAAEHAGRPGDRYGDDHDGDECRETGERSRWCAKSGHPGGTSTPNCAGWPRSSVTPQPRRMGPEQRLELVAFAIRRVPFAGCPRTPAEWQRRPSAGMVVGRSSGSGAVEHSLPVRRRVLVIAHPGDEPDEAPSCVLGLAVTLEAPSRHDPRQGHSTQ